MRFTIDKKIILRIIMFMIIFLSAETLLFGDTPNQKFISIAQYSTFLIILITFITLSPKRLIKSDVLVLGIMLIGLWLSFIVNLGTEQINHYIFKTSLIMAGFLIAASYDYHEIFNEIEKIIFFFTICALVLYALKLIAPSLVAKLPEVTGSIGGRYNTAIIANMNQNTYLWSGFYRIQGIFREPGVYAVYLCISLWHEFFFIPEIRIKRVFIYFVATVLTFSTTAYVCAGVLVFAFILDKNDIKSRRVKGAIIAVFIIGVMYAALFTNIFSPDGLIFSKLYKRNDAYVSGIARFASIYVNIFVFLKNPLFGYGIYHLNDEFSDLAIQLTGRFTGDNTNSFLMSLAAHGIILGGLVFFGWLRFTWKQPWKKRAAIFLIIALTIATSCEYLLNNVIFYLISFMGLKKSYKMI